MPRFLKVILWTLGSLAFLFLICISTIPTLISTPWGTKKAIQWFNRFAPGTLSIDTLELKWIGSQHIENLVYENRGGETVFSVKTFDTETALLYLLFGGYKFGSTTIQKPYLVLEKESKEKKSKEKKTKATSKKMMQWPLFYESLTLRQGTVIFKSAQTSPVTISDIQIEKQQAHTSYQLCAQTNQGDSDGQIMVEFSFVEKTKIMGEVNNFPIAVLDQLGQSSLYTDAIGKTVDLNFDLSKDLDQTITLSAKIESKNLNGLLEGQTKEKKLYLSPSSHLTFTITPKLFHYLLPESQQDEWSLASDAEVSLEIVKGVFPLSIKKPDYRDIVLQLKGSINRAEINHVTLSCYSLNNFKAELIALNNLEISYQGEIHGKELSLLTGEISITPGGDVFFKTDYKGFPVSLVRLISPPIEANIRRLIKHFFDLNTEGTYKDGRLEAKINLTAPNLQIEGEIEGDSNSLHFDLIGNKSVLGKPAEYFGSAVEFKIDGLANFSEDGVSIPLLNGKLSTPYYLIDLRGTIGERGKKLDFNEVELVATGEVIALPFNSDFPQVALKNGRFFINVDSSTNKVLGQAFINTQTSTDHGTIDSKALQTRFEITDYIREDTLDLKNANIFFNCAFDGLPLAILNPLMPGEIDLSSLFGTSAKIDAKGSYTPTQDPRGTLELHGKGDGIEASFSLAIDGTLSVAQNKPAYIRWELTPERYKALIAYLRPDHQSIFQLTKPASVDLSIKELTCPTTLPQDVSHFLCQTGFVGDVKIGTLSFRSYETHEYLVVNNIAGSVEGENFSQAIDLYFSGDIFAQNIPQSESSSFKFKGAMINFWTPDGKFNRKGLALDGELSIEFLPVRQITEIFLEDNETKQLLQAILGELMNARIYGRISQLSGPLTVDIKSSNFKATLPITLRPNAIYLRDYVNAEITLTEAINKVLIKDINPLFIAGAYSDHPIKVYLEPDGFMIPIRPYSLQGVQIGGAIIDVGKIRVRNGGQIQLLMDFLKAKDITAEGEMDAWFTPIFMKLEDGVASYKRFDALLANDVHIALWGSINLINNKVRMTLGIAPSTLQKRFNISGLSNKNMFQVKMRGTTDDLDLDWSSASTRIGIIIARTAGGHIGYIIGGILEQIVTSFGEEPSPLPTTTPFPWERRGPTP